MNIGLKNVKLTEADSIIVPVFIESSKISLESAAEIFIHIKKKEKFKGDDSELFNTILMGENGPQVIIFIGLGKEDELTGEKIRAALSKAVKKCEELKFKKLYVDFINSDKLCLDAVVKAMVEGLRFGSYKFDKYKSDRKEQPNVDVCIGGIDEKYLKEAAEYIDEASILAETTIFARNLVNEPAGVIYPESLSDAVKGYGKEYGFQVEVLDKKHIEKLDMKAFLAVSRGSANDPRFIIMRYFGDEDHKSEILGFVGKGLTFDSGGYSLKTNDGMVTMKCDMAGAAAVTGAMSAIAKMKLKVNVIAVIAACENLISGEAYKPGDIIGSMAGKTIEVLSTDAEGRVTLADAVYYITTKENVTKVIDIATLTGATSIALGITTTAVITNNEDFYTELETASKKSGENVWMLPAFDEYKKLIKSHIADLKNLGGRHAGIITGGLFIGEFAGNKPWIHMDIGGTAWTDEARDYYTKGATGVGVRTLYYLAKNNK